MFDHTHNPQNSTFSASANQSINRDPESGLPTPVQHLLDRWQSLHYASLELLNDMARAYQATQKDDETPNVAAAMADIMADEASRVQDPLEPLFLSEKTARAVFHEDVHAHRQMIADITTDLLDISPRGLEAIAEVVELVKEHEADGAEAQPEQPTAAPARPVQPTAQPIQPEPPVWKDLNITLPEGTMQDYLTADDVLALDIVAKLAKACHLTKGHLYENNSLEWLVHDIAKSIRDTMPFVDSVHINQMLDGKPMR